MKIKFLATSQAPKKYVFEDEKVIIGGVEYDFSVLEEGDIFDGLEGEASTIREAERIDGVLHLTLCQEAPVGHWRGIDKYIDAKDYDPEKLYIYELDEDKVEEWSGF